MAYDEITAVLGGWPGFVIRTVTREPGGTQSGAPRVTIELEPMPGATRHCSRCGQATAQIHDVATRRVRELPILDAETWLVLPLARVLCPTCGPTVEALPWLDRYARMTKRFAESVARLAQVLPIKQVAEWFGLSWDTVQAIDQAALEARLGPVDLTSVRRIVIDEFAIQKGHRYATVVAQPENREVLWVGRGRKREDVRPFFELLGADGCATLEVAVMDMSEAYELETRAHCPAVTIVYDLFHVVAKFGREVIDRVRIDETNRVARAGRHNDGRTRARRRVIKGARWLLLRNRADLPHKDRVRLKELLALNRRLYVVYVLKDGLKDIWSYRYMAVAKRAWDEWYSWAIRSRIPALVTFARNLKAKLPGILAHCRFPLNTGVLEGMNNKIKVIKRMAYGFRNDAYFFLKIRAAFPGNSR
ncbi:MAG TPA: ISL3 family transposase [Candidatus Dormibacteraeota bacterium]|nr:ISL3 family transposase [Candidatus Dormibacteraeota bacterium]